ncbi:calcium/proton exchanger [Ramicandelaber brevisporus]|nr:calcium/proton exchanger [Ramicandelaber brevisporus]KAI8868025.1 calcium/proton exchanger [Ramicandelaber brevisporus]
MSSPQLQQDTAADIEAGLASPPSLRQRPTNVNSLRPTPTQLHAALSRSAVTAGFGTKKVKQGTRAKPAFKIPLIPSIKATVFMSYVNVMLVFIPLGFASHYAHWGDVPTFIINFLAIIPLAKLLGFATEELALSLGEALGGLLNATFGNAVELIMAIIALSEGEITIVQTSLLGSILSNILLVAGFSFLLGGLFNVNKKRNFGIQTFDKTEAQTSAALMVLAILSMMVPSAIHTIRPTGDAAKIKEETDTLNKDVRNMSRGVSLVLIVVYVLFIYFQIFASKPGEPTGHNVEAEGHEEEEEEEPSINFYFAIALLVIATALTALCAEYLIGSLNGLSTAWNLNKKFVGLILLPLVGNAAEHLTAITCAIKDKMGIVIGVAIGSSIQIALFVTPLSVIIGWAMGKPMTLDFGYPETIIMLISVLVLNFIILDGESHWLEGTMLLAAYVIIGISFVFYPIFDETENGGSTDKKPAAALAQAAVAALSGGRL